MKESFVSTIDIRGHEKVLRRFSKSSIFSCNVVTRCLKSFISFSINFPYRDFFIELLVYTIELTLNFIEASFNLI